MTGLAADNMCICGYRKSQVCISQKVSLRLMVEGFGLRTMNMIEKKEMSLCLACRLSSKK